MTIAAADVEAIPLSDYLEFVSSDEIRIRGHRLGLEHVVECYRQGYTPEAIREEYPGLALPAIYATITFYLLHQDIVDEYLARRDARAEAAYLAWLAQPKPPAYLRLQQLKARRALSQS